MRTRRHLFWHAYIVPASVVVGLIAGGWYTFTTLVLLLVIDPLIDALLGDDLRNPRSEEIAELERNRSWDWPLWLAVPTQLAVIGLGLWAIGNLDVSPLEQIGLTVSVGLSSGSLGITVAHELMHRTNWKDRLLSTILMTSTSYPHFSIEHVHGHHRNVGLHQDPATARKGEGYYAFLRRVLVESLASAWQIECTRLERRGKMPKSLANRMVLYGLALTLVYVTILIVFGWGGVLFFAAQSFVAVAELEMINYIEHYGLVRRRDEGALEPMAARHAWDTNSALTNWHLFQLGRHADHHLHAGRRYQLLESLEKSPRLPGGYPVMILLALLPPLWLRVMNRRLNAIDQQG